MLALKGKYEAGVEARNFVGIQLIDRNDELCIMYEKGNINDETLRAATIQMTQRGEEKRMLQIEILELERQLEVTARCGPEVRASAEQIIQLRHAIILQRQVTQKLCAELETPDNIMRWRHLEGADPDEEQLGSRVAQLEDRMGEKKEQLVEKELILEEVESLTTKLHRQATEGRAGTLSLAAGVNDHQARIREVTRQMMATVSELSMYQATALKLQQERDARDAELVAAAQRLEQGLAPTAEAEQAWFRAERHRLQAQERGLRESAAAAAAGGGGAPADVRRTTAVPRPNAYIPDDVGLPKPYGAHAPFKPQDQGSTMRHLRKPAPRDIVI